MRRDDDAFVVIAKYKSALQTANATIRAERKCVSLLVERLAAYSPGAAK